MTGSGTVAVPFEEATQPEQKTSKQDKTKPKRQPPYAVILHNDDINGFDFVIIGLRKVFHYGRMKAFWLTMKAHFTGQTNVWSGSLEVAELKADQLRALGPDPNMKHRGALPLRVTVEPLPE